MFTDVATPQLWTESVFGLTSGWWHLTDRDLRPEQPLLRRDQWESVLRETGFEEVGSLPGLVGLEGEGQIALLARKGWTPPNPALTAETAVESSWVVFADAGEAGTSLAEKISHAGSRCRVVRRGKVFSQAAPDEFTIRANEPEDWKQLFASLLREVPPERFVYLWALDEQPNDKNVLLGTDALLHFTHALEQTMAAARVRIELITRGAQPAGRTSVPTNVALAAAMRKEGRHIPCLVQVNVGDEPQKAGIPRAEAADFVRACREEHGIEVPGLMCIPPAEGDPRPHFDWLANLAARLGLPILSMGMSGDFPAAIEAGATHVRVGSAIFGLRV
jgi:hypothetical protein